MAQEIKMRPIGLAEIVVSYELDQLCDYPNQYRAEDWRETGTLILEIGNGIAHSYVVEEHNDIIKQFTTFYAKNRWHIEVFNMHALLGETFMGYPEEKMLTQNILHLLIYL